MLRQLISLLAACTLLASPMAHATSVAKEGGPVTLIRAGLLLAVPGQAPKAQQTLVVRGQRLVSVHDGYPAAAALGLGEAAEIDLRQRFVMPGLMDMHVHLNITPAAHRAEERTARSYANDPQGADLAALLDGQANARATLMAGYTTVRNVGSPGKSMKVLRDAIEDGTVEGPRMLISGPPLTVQTEYDSQACYSVDTCRRAVRQQIEQGVDLIKVYVTCSGSRPCGSKDAPALFLDDELRAIVEIAATRQMKVAAHAHGTAGINAALHAGVDSIEHGSFNDPTSQALFKQKPAFLVPTLSVGDNIRADYPKATPVMREVMQQFLDKHPANTIAAFRAGVRIAAGSDAGVTVHGNNARELEVYVQNGMPAMAALVAATVNGAALLGRSADLGTLEPGKRADVVAFEGNPLENISALKQVRFVMKDGRVFRADVAR